jgi:hypothetical protein
LSRSNGATKTTPARTQARWPLGQIRGTGTTFEQDFLLTGVQREDGDPGFVKASLGLDGKKNRLTVGKNVWKPMALLSELAVGRRDTLGCATTRCDPPQAVRNVYVVDDGSVRPPARTPIAPEILQRKRWSSLKGHSLQLTLLSEHEPAAVGRENGMVRSVRTL